MTQAEFDRYVLPTYPRFPVTIVSAGGSYIYDDQGKKYLDFLAAWGVSNLGHRPPAVVEAITKQAQELIHVPNVFYTEQQGQLAKLLVENSIEGQVFFGNSGAEANEAAIKFAKLYGQGKRHQIITTERSFHGRTSGAMAATGQEGRTKKGFAPHLAGFLHVPFNDAQALKDSVNEATVAIMLELVQGEGGIHVATPEYVAAIKRLCQEHDLLLIVDEVQTGMGRTGPLLAYQDYDIQPDIISLAKSLASGLPIGVTVVSPKVAANVEHGMHGSTFGGGALVAAAAIATLNELLKPEIRQNADHLAAVLADKLEQLAGKYPCITEVRQKGLMIGVELSCPAQPVVEACLDKGLFVNGTQGNVVRMLPPLTATAEEAETASAILDEVLRTRV